jgi:protein-tyrosine phosphatase
MKRATDLVLVSLPRGRMGLTHRPRKTDLPAFRELGVTHLITLLSENEGAKEVGVLASDSGITWIWCPLRGADITAPPEAVAGALEMAKSALANGGGVAIHCSAGIHRTGMFGYALLRHTGLDRDTAIAKVTEMRAVTADGVGKERLAWGDRVAEALATAKR